MPALANIAYAAFVEQVGEEKAHSALYPDGETGDVDAARQRQAMAVLDEAMRLDL